MSTLNVANISDDQSTLTGANENPNDRLHFNKTVDTKFVTNGCAKVWSQFTDATFLSSMNVSSFTNNGMGSNQVNITHNMSSRHYQVSALTYNSSGNTISMFTEDLTDSCTFRARTWNGSTFIAVNAKNSIGIIGDLA